MKQWVTITAILCVSLGGAQAEPASFKDLLNTKGEKEDRTIEVSVTSQQKTGDKETPPYTESFQAFITAEKPDRVLLQMDKRRMLTDDGFSALWTEDLQTCRVKSLKTSPERWADFAKGRTDAFWVIPTPGNAAYLDENFSIVAIENRKGRMIAKFCLRETPADSYWQKMKDVRGMNVMGAIVLKADTGIVTGSVARMAATGHSRSFKITLTYGTGAIPASLFELPAKVAIRLEEEKAKE